MASEFSHGKMVESTKVNTSMVKNMAVENSTGQTGRNIKGHGVMENNMVREHIQVVKVRRVYRSGSRARGREVREGREVMEEN